MLLVTRLDPPAKFALPATVVFAVDFLWDRPGTALKRAGYIEPRGASGAVPVYCTCVPYTPPDRAHPGRGQLPVRGLSFRRAHTARWPQHRQPSNRRPHLLHPRTPTPGLSPVHRRRRQRAHRRRHRNHPRWDTIYDPSHSRVISPVCRDWGTYWSGYVLFDGDTFFGATLAGIGDKDLANGNFIEVLHEESAEGFVPNYARAGEWKSSDRSEPPVGAITALGLY